ncbi:MAG: phenylacetate--CoA ligase family protein [Actinomycetia bacterium]|nr:phenylacetate--CoA ligase family protein [Actinomycetes bacterium]
MSRADLAALQEARLLETLPFVYERSDLINSIWRTAGVHPRDIRTLDDFRERAPFMSKDVVRQYRAEHHDPYGGVRLRDPSRLVAVMSTSGTTGDPALLPVTDGVPISGLGFSRDFYEIGVRPDDYVFIALFTFRGCGWEMPQRLGAVPVLFDHDASEIDRFCRWALELRPTSMFLLSGYLINTFATEAERLGYDLTDVFSSIKGVIYGGEPLGTRARATVSSWGVELFDHSALGDVAWAMECREHDGMHFPEDLAFVEHLEPGGRTPAADGELGELVVTSLDPHLSPYIRFRSDDLVRLTETRCACGRTHARLWPVGRLGDETIVNGRVVMPVDVWRGIERVDATSAALFQIIRPQREVDSLRLRVGYDESLTTPVSEIRDAVVAAVAAELDIEPDVELVPEADLLKLGPPHKIPRMVRS